MRTGRSSAWPTTRRVRWWPTSTPTALRLPKGIRPGDVITEVNHKAVKTPGDAVAALRAAKKGEHALLLVRRGDSQRFVALSFS